MPNAFNDRLKTIREIVRENGIDAVDNEDLTLMITYPAVTRYDIEDEEKGIPK